MKLKSLDDLLVEELRDLYDAELQITKALPKMAEKASSAELRSAFQERLHVTEQHIQRLDQVFQQLGQSAKGKSCEAMQGILREGEQTMHEKGDPAVMDAALIASAQRVEHYEIAGYGAVRTHAQQLGHYQAARLLQETLNDEREADKRLTQIAEHSVNVRAASGQTERRA